MFRDLDERVTVEGSAHVCRALTRKMLPLSPCTISYISEGGGGDIDCT